MFCCIVPPPQPPEPHPECNSAYTSPQFVSISVCSQPAEILFFVYFLLFLMGAQCAALIISETGYCMKWSVCNICSRFNSVMLKYLYFCTLSQALLFAHFIGVNMLSILTYLISFFEILRYFLFIYLHLLIPVDSRSKWGKLYKGPVCILCTIIKRVTWNSHHVISFSFFGCPLQFCDICVNLVFT